MTGPPKGQEPAAKAAGSREGSGGMGSRQENGPPETPYLIMPKDLPLRELARIEAEVARLRESLRH